MKNLFIVLLFLCTNCFGQSFESRVGTAVSGTYAPATAPTFATSITGSYLTASEILGTNGSKNIVSLPVATYPSLTELTYVKGATSNLQTQITARLLVANPAFTGIMTTGTLGYTATNALLTLESSVNAFNQFIIKNSSNGAAASSDVVVNNDQSTNTTFYGDFGMNSSGFTGAGAFNQPNYVFLTSTSSDLAIGTTTNHGIHFVVNSGATDVMSISNAGAITINGSIALGTNNITMTGSLAATGARVTKGWFTDIESTNMPTVGGTSLSSTFQASDADLTTWAGITPAAGVGTYLATPTSANLRSMITDENGTGALLFNGATSPDFTTGFTIGTAAATGNTLIGNGTTFVSQNTRENWTTFAVSGSAATTTGQTLVDITGLTSGTLSNSTKYEVEAWLDVATSAVTTGTQYAIFANGTGGAAVYNALVTGTTTTNATTSVTQSSATQQGTFLTTSGTSGVIYIHGFVTTRGSGTATISIQHLKVTSGTSTVQVGSKMKIRLAN